MKCYYVKYLLAATLLWHGATMLANGMTDSLKTSIECPAEVAKDSAFNISYTIYSSSPSSFSLTHHHSSFIIPNMEMLSGPSVSIMTSYIMKNNRDTTERSQTFTYSFVCHKEGVFTTPVLTAKDEDGNECVFGRKTIRVKTQLKGDTKAQRSECEEENGNATSGRDTTFIILSLNKNKIHLHEKIRYKITVYSTENIQTIQIDTETGPDYCYREELEQEKQQNTDSCILCGKVYKSLYSCEYELTPLITGRFTMNPITLHYISLISKGSDPFDDFFNSNYSTIEKAVKSNGITFFVEPDRTNQNEKDR